MQKLYQILYYLIPLKGLKKKFKRYYITKTCFDMTQERYARKIETLKQKKKIKVAFLVWENCKWSYDSLYKKFAADSNYDPLVMVINENSPVCNLQKNLDFFTTKKYNVVQIDSPKQIAEYEPDIIFYEQPWFALTNDYAPFYLSKFALCFYVPYFVELDMHNNLVKKRRHFYLSVYQTFVFNSAVQKDMEQLKIMNTVPTGHPRFDSYKKSVTKKDFWKTENKVRIIFAPHHSFKNSILKWSAYEWSGNHLLDLAKKYADCTEWIFKPHPRFHVALTQEFGKEYADKIFAEWSKVSQLYDKGDYFDLFRTADLMISDCGSFKIEWLPTLKPYIHLVSQYPNTEPLGPMAQHFSSGYYYAKNLKELDDYFNQLVIKKSDPLKQRRDQLIKEVYLNASEKIFDYIQHLLERG